MTNFESNFATTSIAVQSCYSRLSERELVTLIASGDSNAFAAICQKYEHRLFRTAIQITRNTSDAEDVVQETFLKAYKNIATFRFDSRLSTWLTQIVINCSLMELRRRKSRRWLSLDDANEDGISLMELVPDATSDVEGVVCLNEQRRLLSERITRLPPHLRGVMQTYWASGPTMAEMAEAHSLSLPAVKSRLLRAKAMLRKSR